MDDRRVKNTGLPATVLIEVGKDHHAAGRK
jgi:hypothetical protein